MSGRPPKFETLEQMQEAKDGKYVFTFNNISNSDFRYESDLSSYLINNIELLCSHLGDEYVSVDENLHIEEAYGLRPRSRRIDIFLRCKKKIYIIELKNPTAKAENRSGIGQLLDYGREFPYPEKELLLISTKFDINTARTIKHYMLPIRYFYFSKKHLCEYLGDA